MSKHWRVAITFVIAGFLGLLLSIAQNEIPLSEIETLLLGQVVLFCFIILALPWVMIGHGWIWMIRRRKEFHEDHEDSLP